MKTLIVICSSILLSACSWSASAPVEQPVTKSSVDTIAVAVVPDDTDAKSGATNVANPTMLNGTITIPPQNNITIALPIGGIISSFTHLTGEFVRKGEVIAVLENSEFIDLQQLYLESAAQSVFLEAEYNRQRALAAEDVSSQRRLQQSLSDYESIKSRREASAARLLMLGVDPQQIATQGIASKLNVRAPQNGYISEVMVNQGKFVAAGEEICLLINKDQIFINLIAYEKDLKSIKTGQKVEFRVNGLGEELFEAVVCAIDQRVDPINRSVKIYAKVSNPRTEFRPGMYVTAQVK